MNKIIVLCIFVALYGCAQFIPNDGIKSGKVKRLEVGEVKRISNSDTKKRMVIFGWSEDEVVDPNFLRVVRPPNYGSVKLGEDSSVYTAKKSYNGDEDFLVVRISREKIAIVNLYINDNMAVIFYTNSKEF